MATGKKVAPKSNGLTLREIAKRAGITTREIRDVVTGIGTVATTKNPLLNKMAKGNLKMQIKEVGKAVTKGKTGTKPVVKAKKSGTEQLNFGGKR
jgi:transcriptional regulator with XRE-family HTH domain